MRTLNPKSLILNPINKMLGRNQKPHKAPYLINEIRKGRPIESLRRKRGADIQLPLYPVSLMDLEGMARDCDIIRMCTVKIKLETFRRGYEWTPAIEDSQPDTSEYLAADEFFHKVNSNNQNLVDVLKKVEDDLNIFDDAYLIIVYNYFYDQEGDVVKKTVREMIRGNPIYMRQVSDEHGNMGGLIKVCIKHKNEAHGIDETACHKCGRKLYDTHYVSLMDWGTENVENYYIEGEVLHLHKYEDNLIYGYSPIASFWRKAYTLIGMDKYSQDYYELQRPPGGALIFPTRNQESLIETKDKIDLERRSNPNYLPWMAVEPDSKIQPQFLNMSQTMEELKYIELRREYRERISGFYGVSPIMQGDVSQGGGLNSVLGDTPIIVRKDGKHVDILPIAVLHADYDHTKSKYGLSRYEALSRTGWTPITYSFRQKNSKKIYDITTNDGFTQVTEDHSLFMNGEETRGSEVKVGDKLDIIKPEIKLNDTDSISPELSWALGFYAAEGSSTKLGRNKNNNERQGVRVTVHQTDKKPLEQCKDAFDSFFGVNSKLRLQKNSNGNDIHCLDLSHNHVYDWINKYCYSTYIKRNILDEKTKTTIHREKKVPIQVLNGGKKIQQAFVDGYWMGDGHTDKKGCRRCSGVYKSLMSGLQYLFNQLGETTSISWRSNGKNHIIRMGVLKSGERQKHRLENEVKDIREYDYYGDLYDIETEDHSFVAGVGNILHHNSEGLQFAVTNRAVEHAQMIYNKYVLPFLLDAFGILSWKLELIPSEEEDEMAELQRASQELANARMAVEVGLEVKYKDGKFSITDGILEKPEAGGFPSFGESMEAGGEARQVTGLPDSMQRSLKKEDVPSVKVVKEFTNDDFPIIVEYEE